MSEQKKAGPINIFGKRLAPPFAFDVGTQVVGNSREPVRAEGTVQEGDDLSNLTISDISEFVKEITSINAYSVFPEQLPTGNIEANGRASFNDSSTNDEEFEKDRSKLSAKDNSYGRIDSLYYARGDNFVPGKSKVNGHELLQNGAEEAVKFTESNILSRNRFSSSKKSSTESSFFIKTTDDPVSLGENKNDNYPSAQTYDEPSEFSTGDLQNIALILSRNAAGRVVINDNPSGAAASTAALLPKDITATGAGYLSQDDLSVRSALETLKNSPDYKSGKSSGTSQIDIMKSWGQMNPIDDSFSTDFASPPEQIIYAYALAAATVALLKLASALIGLDKDQNDKDALKNFNNGIKILFSGATSDLIPPSSVTETKPILPGDSGSRFGSDVLESAGYYVVFYRAIYRNVRSIIENTVNSITQSPTNLITTVESAAGSIKNSKLVSLINLLKHYGKLNNPKSIIDLDSELAGTAYSGYAARVPNTRYTAWASSQTPSNLLLPHGIPFDDSAKGQNDSRDEKSPTRIRRQDTFSMDDVKIIEQKLESEYVPFYFHDLRTNEVLSFPCFIKELSDGYSAAWSNDEFYGRTDNPKIYKSTARKISFGFYVVSTNYESFEDMWQRINKLVTMVYPQRSAGSIRQSNLFNKANTVNYQPFTQVQSASPLVRIRIGDLIKTNYSRFNLMGLFGDFEASSYKQVYTVTFINNATLEKSTIKTATFIDSDSEYITDKTNYSKDDFSVWEKRLTELSTNVESENFSPSNNIIVKSFEDNMSQGLAAAITNLTLDYNIEGGNWETAYWGSRAPKMVYIKIDIDPIHDLPLGLNHKGRPLSDAYNIGESNLVAGRKLNEDDTARRNAFNNATGSFNKYFKAADKYYKG
jgi:hypothetical protein